MLQYSDPIPFTIENESHLGLSEVQGLLHCDGRNIIIEYRVADTVIGLLKSNIKEIAIPLADVWTIKFEKKFMGMSNSILLRLRRQQAIESFPESRSGEVKFKIKRGDRKSAEDFCLDLGQAVLRNRGELMSGELDRQQLDE